MNTMNIIRHLTTTISPQVLGDSPKAGERSLLKDFYAIFLARLSEKKTYNTLTNHGRLSAKKISWYKFVHNIDWHEEDGKTLLSAFATAHQLDETDIYDLLKLATLIYSLYCILTIINFLPIIYQTGQSAFSLLA